ncbi:grpE [Symbiodinium natans]|uniref:GrpE protein n=1 Tax=Symbiodinium natans TaxID=878477 RepID=A0A812V509_9DINO|nr:grpE [Symbiodinium natans]
MAGRRPLLAAGIVAAVLAAQTSFLGPGQFRSARQGRMTQTRPTPTARRSSEAESETTEELSEAAKANIEKLTAEIAELNTVKEEKQAAHSRLKLEIDNFRQRTSSELAAARGKAAVPLVQELLPIADEFEYAKQNLKVETDGQKSVVAKFEALFDKMLESWKSLGIEKMSSVGEAFNPELHEAVSMIPSEEYKEEVVCNELRPGWILKTPGSDEQQVLRAALVIVSSGRLPPMVTIALEPTLLSTQGGQSPSSGRAEGSQASSAGSAKADVEREIVQLLSATPWLRRSDFDPMVRSQCPEVQPRCASAVRWADTCGHVDVDSFRHLNVTQSAATAGCVAIGEAIRDRPASSYAGDDDICMTRAVSHLTSLVRSLSEVVFLVGSSAALGCWDTYQGIMLETSPVRFPWWYTASPVVLDGMPADFQFAISDRSLSSVRWEGLPYHRRLQCRPMRGKDGQQLEMVFRASWEDEAACRSVGLAKRYEQSVVRTQKPP